MNKVITFNPDKKGLSIMIGYILLITGAVAMGAIVFQWMKSYVPKDAIDCSDGTSLFISESSCEKIGINYKLVLKLKNNGRFDVGGFFIHATDGPDQTLATFDLTDSITSTENVENKAVLLFPLDEGLKNSFKPNEDLEFFFSVSKKLYSVEIIPIRVQIHENKKRLVTCGNAKIFENLQCGLPDEEEEEIPEDCVAICTGGCGDDGCGGTCECETGFNCVAEVCVAPECTDTCDSLGYMCGTHTICGTENFECPNLCDGF